MKHSRTASALALSFFLLCAGAAAQAHKKKSVESGKAPFTMYRYPIAASGSCVPPHGSSPEKVLARNGITYRGKPTEAEVEALAKGIGQVQNLLGKPIPKSWRTKFNFINASGKWNQGANSINIRRPRGSPKGENVGRMMHEFGHKVGNAGAYKQYRKFIGEKECRITGYCTPKHNEQFAEVFEAYIVYPDLLKEKCPRSYQYFAEKLFKNSENKVATCEAGTSTRGTSRKGKGVQ